jgi:hypothetical protein
VTTLDVVGAIVLIACFPAAVTVLVRSVPATRPVRVGLVAVLTAWFLLITATAIPGVGPVPGGAFAILVPVLGGTVLLVRNREARRLLALAALAPLIALHVTRLAGGAFVLLNAEGRLADPFATVAGWGDVLAAVTAVPVAVLAARRRPGWERWVLAWSTLGLADFLVAIVLGFTSAPGSPLQVFTEASVTEVLSDLPWRYIPFYFVPLYVVVHIAIYLNLFRARARRTRPTVPAA